MTTMTITLSADDAADIKSVISWIKANRPEIKNPTAEDAIKQALMYLAVESPTYADDHLGSIETKTK